MGGWGPSSPPRPPGTADADYPSAEKVERRRQADIDFLIKIRTCGDRAELEALRHAVSKVRWKVVCIDRRLRQLERDIP